MGEGHDDSLACVDTLKQFIGQGINFGWEERLEREAWVQ